MKKIKIKEDDSFNVRSFGTLLFVSSYTNSHRNFSDLAGCQWPWPQDAGSLPALLVQPPLHQQPCSGSPASSWLFLLMREERGLPTLLAPRRGRVSRGGGPGGAQQGQVGGGTGGAAQDPSCHRSHPCSHRLVSSSTMTQQAQAGIVLGSAHFIWL